MSIMTRGVRCETKHLYYYVLKHSPVQSHLKYNVLPFPSHIIVHAKPLRWRSTLWRSTHCSPSHQRMAAHSVDWTPMPKQVSYSIGCSSHRRLLPSKAFPVSLNLNSSRLRAPILEITETVRSLCCNKFSLSLKIVLTQSRIISIFIIMISSIHIPHSKRTRTEVPARSKRSRRVPQHPVIQPHLLRTLLQRTFRRSTHRVWRVLDSRLWYNTKHR